jgi:hypothetical protein
VDSTVVRETPALSEADAAAETAVGASAGDVGFGDMRGVPLPSIEVTASEPIDGPSGLRRSVRIRVTNHRAYPKEMFQLRPDFAPCGLNPNASRTWVQIYDEHGRLYGYCALDAPSGLARMGASIPSTRGDRVKVYIVLIDRATGLEYKSNLVEVAFGR